MCMLNQHFNRKIVMRRQIINEFSQIININSTSSNFEGIHQKGELIQSMLTDLTLDWERVSMPNAANFFVTRSRLYNPDTPTLLLSGHIDTVFPFYPWCI